MTWNEHDSIFISLISLLLDQQTEIFQDHVKQRREVTCFYSTKSRLFYFIQGGGITHVRQSHCSFNKQQFVLHNYRTSDNKTLIYAQHKGIVLVGMLKFKTLLNSPSKEVGRNLTPKFQFR